MELSIDKEFRDLISPLTEVEFTQLKENILAEGCRDPLVVWNRIILDGHNRYAICQSYGVPFKIHELNLSGRNEAINWIIDNQLGRRNLSPWQMSILRGKRYNAEKADKFSHPKSDSHYGHRLTSEKLSEQYGVSSHTIRRDGDFAKVAELAAKENNIPIMQLSKAQILEVAKEIQQEKRDERRAERIENLIEISSNNKPLEGIGKFPVLLCDPPWQYDFPISDSRRIENQYPTMSIDEICNLPVSEICTDDAIIFLWSPPSFIHKGLRVLSAWGFDFRTTMVWVKPSIGPGQWVRQRHELILIGIKGNIPTPRGEDKPDSVIEAPREEHSKKPDIIYDIIEKMYPELPKIELFCRKPRNGWSAWGNEI